MQTRSNSGLNNDTTSKVSVTQYIKNNLFTFDIYKFMSTFIFKDYAEVQTSLKNGIQNCTKERIFQDNVSKNSLKALSLQAEKVC